MTVSAIVDLWLNLTMYLYALQPMSLGAALSRSPQLPFLAGSRSTHDWRHYTNGV